MTDPRPNPAPKRSARLNGVVILLVLLLFAIAGAYVWTRWSADAATAADDAADGPVQPASAPPPGAGAPSPEGAEAPR
ncbi:hypothetical protein [Brevundimonas sp.]|uniref:hypothetical protein n=1 Tax=Brevundimonas sp. TaxID=1871086 RepID=UPI002D6BE579|nr:hypothetical protein [Brevundimonas sp.]HYD26705.1 hypothetical protein [Brevundimonas sp.]